MEYDYSGVLAYSQLKLGGICRKVLMSESSDKDSVFGLSGEQIERLLSIGYGKDGDVVEPPSTTSDSEHKPALSSVEETELSLQIDGYEVIEKVAEAGQGQVWRALQQSTGRFVAIKVPRLGSVTSERARVRFEREIELAARLKHPNIARIYDSGVERGQYYYVMDFVDGLNLDDYVMQHGLTHRQILELMRTVCQSVQHAHQNGVIHRDLKPSNIIVTKEGRPFIVDFGLAKGFFEDDQKLVISVDGETVGTPAYMSPEQAAGHTDKVDTRTDVYSLGVTLFTLLTGSNPHDLSGSHLEVLHRIADEEVKHPRSLNRKIDKDLEALLLKALDRDPDRRYSSAAGLTEDIDNYLKGEPLIAGSQSGVYRLRKFVKRNRLLVTSVAAVITVLVVGVVVSTIFALKARRQANLAQAVAGFLTEDLLQSIDPVKAQSQEVAIRHALDAASEKLEGKFQDEPLIEAQIRQTLGLTYRRIGEVQQAEPHLERVLRIREKELGEEHPDTQQTMRQLGLVYSNLGRYADAETLHTKSFELSRRILGEDHTVTLWSMAQVGTAAYNLGCYDKAESLWTRALRENRRLLGDEAQLTARTMAKLARAYTAQGRYDEAERLFLEALELQRRVESEESPELRITMGQLARLYTIQGKYDQAEPLLVTPLETLRRVLGERHRITLGTKHRLAMLYTAQGRYEEATRLLNETLNTRRQKYGDDHPHTLQTIKTMGQLRRAQQHYDEAESLLRQALDGSQRKLGPDHPETLESKHELAMLYKEQGRYDEAEPLLLEAVEGRILRLSEKHPYTQESIKNLIELYEACGKPEEADKWRAKLPRKEDAEEP